jgi:hypothetical protein
VTGVYAACQDVSMRRLYGQLSGQEQAEKVRLEGSNAFFKGQVQIASASSSSVQFQVRKAEVNTPSLPPLSASNYETQIAPCILDSLFMGEAEAARALCPI